MLEGVRGCYRVVYGVLEAVVGSVITACREGYNEPG